MEVKLSLWAGWRVLGSYMSTAPGAVAAKRQPRAEEAAREISALRMAVISGVGAGPYFRRLGSAGAAPPCIRC